MKTTTTAFTLLGAAALSTATPLKRASGTDAVSDTTVLNYALTLEHLENAFYSGALAKFDDKAFTDAGLPSTARGLFTQIAAHEQAHVEFLSAALGSNATEPCTYSFPYTNPKEFAAVSQILEGVGVSAYAGAAQYITNPAYLTAAAVVLSTEARHSSWVAAAVNDVEPWSGGLDVPLSLDQVYSLASAFITSCPDSNPALPVKAFPALSFTPATAQPGDEISLSFNGLSDGQIVFFLTGLASENATVSDGKVTIPKDLAGTIYMVVGSSDAKAVSDDTTVAGPAVLQFQKTVGALSTGSGSNSTSSTTSMSGGSNGAASLSTGFMSMGLVAFTAVAMAMFV